jgi:CRISPR-associated protein Cas2
MAERVMLTVYCYDITEARTRARVAGMLEECAVRVQDSVFEMRLTRAAADRLYDRVAHLLDDGDLLRMYAVGAAGLERCRSHGGAPIANDGDYWIV